MQPVGNDPDRVTAPMIQPEELEEWILQEDEDLLVLNKPGWVVCHPSKRGPWSSLIGACRERAGGGKLHLIARLDRETSGLVLVAKNPKTARRLQMAVERRRVDKCYLAFLVGEWEVGPVGQWHVVDRSLGRDPDSSVFVKQMVRESGRVQPAVTRFLPLRVYGGFTIAMVFPETGRKHQIRVHAQWLGHPLVGDKLYGPDESLYLEFGQQGWTDRMEQLLDLPRQALHALRIRFFPESEGRYYIAPPTADLVEFATQRLGLAPDFLEPEALLSIVQDFRATQQPSANSAGGKTGS